MRGLSKLIAGSSGERHNKKEWGRWSMPYTARSHVVVIVHLLVLLLPVCIYVWTLHYYACGHAYSYHDTEYSFSCWNEKIPCIIIKKWCQSISMVFQKYPFFLRRTRNSLQRASCDDVLEKFVSVWTLVIIGSKKSKYQETKQVLTESCMYYCMYIIKLYL